MAEKKTGKRLLEADTYYTIVAKQSGRVIEAGVPEMAGDELVRLAASDGSDRQLWRFAVEDDGCYKLICKASEKALDIIAAGVDDGSWVHQWDAIPHIGSQLWYVEPVEEGCCKIKARFTDKCLDVVGLSQEEGARLQIWEDVNGDNQKWRIEPVQSKAPKKPAAQKASAKAEKEEVEADKPEKPVRKKPAAKKPAARKTAAKTESKETSAKAEAPARRTAKKPDAKTDTAPKEAVGAAGTEKA